MVLEFVHREVLRPASDSEIASRAQEAGNAEQTVEMLFVVPAIELRLVLRIDVRPHHEQSRSSRLCHFLMPPPCTMILCSAENVALRSNLQGPTRICVVVSTA